MAHLQATRTTPSRTVTPQERRRLWRNLRKLRFRQCLLRMKRQASSQRRSWGQTQKETGSNAKIVEQQHGKTDDRIIIETDLLRSGIEANPGPTGEMTAKMPRYQKWTRSLSQWLVPYVKRCEATLTCRVQLLLSFLDPTAEATACIFPW